MAATGFTPISLYYTTTASAAPTAGNLVAGELAINTTDGKLYYKDSAGVVKLLASNAGSAGDVVGPSSSTDNAVARFDTTTGKLIQNSLVTISDTGAISAPVDALISGLTVGKGAGSVATNTAVGLGAVAGTGNENTGFGQYPLANNTNGGSNTAVGFYPLVANTTGSNNSAFGSAALTSNTTGSQNTAVGRNALNSNTTASNNTAVGYQAGYSNTTGTYNTFVGNAAGYTSNGNHNTCLGDRAGYSLTTGVSNTFIGGGDDSAYPAGYFVTTGSKNSILGNFSGNQGGLDIRTANSYIVLSDGDGNPRYYWDTAGWNSQGRIFINTASAVSANQGNGTGALGTSTTLGATLIGQGSSNDITFLNKAGSIAGYIATGATTITTSSDERIKENLVNIDNGLEKVVSLRAVIGNYVESFDPSKARQPFLIAQDLDAVLPEAVVKSNPDEWGVNYSQVIPLLVSAIKELKAEVDSLKQQLGK